MEIESLPLMMAVAVIMILLLGGMVIYSVISQEHKNYEEIGIKMTDYERDCYEACGGENNYFYAPGGMFSSATCTCGLNNRK